LYVLDCIAGVHFLTFHVVLNAAFGFADGAGALADNAAAYLDSSECVQTAEGILFPFHLSY